jgi:signal transduction histidine kinase/HAMP domain-containing protein
VVALSEVALPADSIRRGAWESVGFLLGIGVLVTLCGSVLAFLITRRITSPLRTLAAAAERMGAGDLETPIPISSGWIAIDRLANQLERSRKSLRQTHLIARRELRRVVHLLGATREGVVTINMDGIVTWANEDACQILGYKISKLLRQPCLQIFRPASDGAVTVSELLQPPPGQLPPTRLAIIDGRGNSIALAITCALLDTEDVNTALRREYALILRDVSEEQAINRLRTEFLATVAHEFRTPLSTIFASTELLVDEGHDMSPDELSNLAHTIHMTTVHLQTLVDNLLESAIIEAGFFRLRYRPLQLPDILNNVVEMISPLLQRRQQHLEVDAPQDLSHFWGDVNRIKQALINLVENASKFSPGGVAITLRVQPVTDALKFEVLDKGSGLPTEQFSGLFERYVTGDHPSGGQYGIGLGLPIVKAIAEAHGGQVGAENRPGGGARVWFTIPLKQKDAGGEEKK